eukprot:399359-Pyramimonas_sp.AAC.1
MECWWLQGRGYQTVFVCAPQVGTIMEHIRSIVREWRRQKFMPQGTCSYGGTPIYRVENTSRKWGSHTSRGKSTRKRPAVGGGECASPPFEKRRQRV